ncbi:MAG TPA: hypothetical protein PKE66_03745 [Pyrinomonadaceae bacterium]|nr:hypothetical protein [Pyrinomonadaceae bacterium]
MRMRSYLVLTVLFMLSASGVALADLKVKTRQTVSGQSYENTTLIKGKRQRSEMMNGSMVNITQCDLKRAIRLNPATKTFTVDEFGQIEPAAANTSVAATKAQTTTKGGRVMMTINIRDTGERKQMFGLQARRLVITTTMESSPDACTPVKTKMETDGWYADLEAGFDCDMAAYSAPVNARSGGCRDRFETKQTGTGKRGFALYEKMTMFDDAGKETMSMVSEVIELSKAALDATLFEVPAGYREVDDAAQMYAGAGNPASTSTPQSTKANNGTGSPLATNVSRAASSPSIDDVQAGEKKPGTIRIGLANVKTGSLGKEMPAAELAEAVRNTLISYLKMPNVEVMPLEARLQTAIDAEAKAKDCDIVIYATVSHKKGGGGFGMFSKLASPALSSIGYGSTAGAIAASTVISAGSIAGNVKSKDELKLEVRVVNSSGQAIHAGEYKAKAKNDGDDILTSLVEQAAEAIVKTIK